MAIGRRTIIVCPAGLAKCTTFAESTNQGILLTNIGKEHEILILSISEYIWQWVTRITNTTPHDMGQLYKELETQRAETFHVEKLRGSAKLIKDHLDTARRIEWGYNLNAIRIARQIASQQDKDNNIKGGSFIFITNGGAHSTLEMISNLQACSNAMQRLIGEGADWVSSVSPPRKKSGCGNLPRKIATGQNDDGNRSQPIPGTRNASAARDIHDRPRNPDNIRRKTAGKKTAHRPTSARRLQRR